MSSVSAPHKEGGHFPRIYIKYPRIAFTRTVSQGLQKCVACLIPLSTLTQHFDEKHLVPILQIRKLRLREGPWLAQGAGPVLKAWCLTPHCSCCRRENHPFLMFQVAVWESFTFRCHTKVVRNTGKSQEEPCWHYHLSGLSGYEAIAFRIGGPAIRKGFFD